MSPVARYWYHLTYSDKGRLRRRRQRALPVLFGYLDCVGIDSILEPPFRLRDFEVVDAGLALAHPPVVGESPVFQSCGAFPVAIMRILVLVPELHRNSVAAECKELFPEPVVLFLFPLCCQEVDYGFCADDETVSIPESM